MSIEPLLAPLGRLDLHRIDWVIVGGESGPMCVRWIPSGFARSGNSASERRFRFFKQMGGRWKHRTGRELDVGPGTRCLREIPSAWADAPSAGILTGSVTDGPVGRNGKELRERL